MPNDHKSMTVTVPDLPQGTYTVVWKTLSAADGHAVKGASVGAQRIAEESARNVGQKRNERRLIDVSPGKVIAARHVIKFVAKIPVAVVEIKV